MRELHITQMYPPRVKITVTMKKNDPISLLITFSGSLMNNHLLDLKLTFPLGMYIQGRHHCSTIEIYYYCHNNHYAVQCIWN